MGPVVASLRDSGWHQMRYNMASFSYAATGFVFIYTSKRYLTQEREKVLSTSQQQLEHQFTTHNSQLTHLQWP